MTTGYGTATTSTYYYMKDHLGSVHMVLNIFGGIVEEYEYDAWGNVKAYTNGVEVSESTIGNRYLWQGREYSWKTGFYFFRARWYDPITGRWLSNDPKGISGGLNQYVFCADNPVNFVDPYGLDVVNHSTQWILVKIGEDYDVVLPNGTTETRQQWILLEPGWTYVGPNDGIMWQDRRIFKVSGDYADIEVECEGKVKSDFENRLGDIVKKILPFKLEPSGFYTMGDGTITGDTWDPRTLLDVIKKRNAKR